ncbi:MULTISPECIES: hypothetical protein [unclassified Oceanobacter]|uniref:hypothetical protein n=1 Tax=unclassified Oceanobacter TaxID=2620260 RepID=UPI00273460DA|nr:MULTISPECIES: hypothetical protein [unclassified Oceanobacter]MDP2610020.1 hypothetical protein [Oceanobacter sp. 1_MG-2023]MDP2613344.1 hypothetical protein [Oceanobacter sp. 2_MG-2023]
MMLDTISLPENLYWSGETTFKPWASSQERAVSGALIIDVQALSYGQPIVLTGAWIHRADLAVLQALESSPLTKRTLTLNDSTVHTVLIDLASGGISATPLAPETTPTASTLYELTIHLITVEPDPESE